MSERAETKPKQARDESAEQRQQKQVAAKRRPTETLTDENPLICRGMD